MSTRRTCDNCGQPGAIWCECGTCTDAGDAERHELHRARDEITALREALWEIMHDAEAAASQPRRWGDELYSIQVSARKALERRAGR